MPWSIFTQGGGPGVARTWAVDLLTKIGAPLTQADEQVVYDWEVSEGGGGAFNPLNQGPDSITPGLSTTGQQYGGGAADYAGWAAGIQGAADYLSMPNFAKIAADLRAGDASTARADIIASPWAASHYGYGAAFNNSPLPGQAQALPAITGAGAATGSGSGAVQDATLTGYQIPGVSSVVNGAKNVAIVVALVVVGGAVVVLGFVRMTKTASNPKETPQ